MLTFLPFTYNYLQSTYVV